VAGWSRRWRLERNIQNVVAAVIAGSIHGLIDREGVRRQIMLTMGAATLVGLPRMCAVSADAQS